MEAPSNPQQSFCDVKALAELAHSWEIPFIIDATCATPALMRPIAYGADVVIHSLTKSITSGGLAIGGAVISRKPIITKVKNDHPLFKESLPNTSNSCLTGPRAVRHTNERPVRLKRPPHLRSKMDLVSQNCQKVAEFLSGTRVYQVDYLGLSNFHYHPLAKKYLKLVDSDNGKGNEVNRYGHLMSFRVDGPPENARRFTTISRSSSAPPTWDGSRAWPRSRRSPHTSSRARKRGRRPTFRRSLSGYASAARTPTTSSPTSTRPWLHFRQEGL